MAENSKRAEHLRELAAIGADKLEFYSSREFPIGASGMKLLKEYSHIPADEIKDHIEKISPFPCIGMFRFLELELPVLPIYPEVLQRLKGGETFLDLGCCFGQELRQLIFDGVPGQNLYGCDLRQRLMDVGYELFRDKSNFNSKLIESNVFKDDSELVNQLSGKMDIVYAGSFFHLFDYEEQKAVGKRVIQLLKSKKDGMIIGRQVGNAEAGLQSAPGYKGERKRFGHNVESWKKMWGEIGEETGTKWDSNVEMDDFWMTEGPESELSRIRRERGARRLRFVMRRVME